jgi:hypothetical protein
MPMWVWIAAGLGSWVALSAVLGLLLGRFLEAITSLDSRSDERLQAATVSLDDESEFWLNWGRTHPAETVARERGVPEGPTARALKERVRTV